MLSLNSLLRSVLAVSLLLLLAAPLARSADLIIAPGGEPWKIFHEDGAPDSVSQAARELQDYVKKVSGAELPIVTKVDPGAKWVIWLGDTVFAREQGVVTKDLPRDGFRVLTGDDWIVIAGRDYAGPPQAGTENPYQLHETYNTKLKISAFGDAGTLQGVYWFLRKFCEVRWYMPGPLGEVVPHLDKIVVTPTDVKDAPVFEYRYPFFCFFDTAPVDALWYRRAGFGAPFPVAINHSFQRFHKYKDTNPEFFALIDGQRDFTTLSSVHGPGNLNLSNPDLVKQAIADINQFFDENPGEMLFPIVPPDGMHRISEDPESQAQIDMSQGGGGKFSNYVWGFINKVAKGVYEKHPDKFIAGIAYERYSFPPTNLEKLPPNVIVMVCKARRVMPDPKLTASLRSRIDAWSKLAEQVYCWEYYCDVLFNAGWRGYPAHYPPAFIQEDMQFLKGKTKGEMIEAETFTPDQFAFLDKIVINDPGLQHLRLYVTSQLLWNPDLDLPAMLGEYYRLFYGPAEAEMRKFWETAEKAWATRTSENPSGVYGKETLSAMLQDLVQAREKTEAGSVYRQRVDLIEKEFSPAAAKAGRLSNLEKRESKVGLITATKTVDGNLGGSFWARIPMLNLIDSNYSSAMPPTHVRLAWTPEDLKIAMTSFEPEMGALKTAVTPKNWKPESPIWEDDAVEIFLQPAGGDVCVQFIANAAGAACLARRSLSDRSPVQLLPLQHTRVAVVKGKTSWTVEMSIPWKELGVSNPAAGLPVKANFFRSRRAGGELQEFSWAPMVRGQFFEPDDFGTITLSPDAGD